MSLNRPLFVLPKKVNSFISLVRIAIALSLFISEHFNFDELIIKFAGIAL